MSALNIKNGLWQANDLAANIDCGFVPDEVELIVDTEKTAPDIIRWSNLNYVQNTAYGILLTGSSGETSQITGADTGIIPYDTVTQQVLIPSPDGGPPQARTPTLYDADSGVNYSGLNDRTVTTAGSVVRPITKNGYVYELKTGIAVSAAEPTWPTVPGDEVTDNGSNVWTCRKENVVAGGFQGFTAGVDIQTDGKWYSFRATKAQDAENYGDADAF